MALPLSYNVRNLRARWKVTLLAIFGIGMVVAAFVTILAMSRGFSIALSSTGSDDNAIVTQRGSLSELTSWIDIGSANLIMVDPRVARNAGGKPMASCEVVVITSRPKKETGMATNVTFRGVTPAAFQVRNGVKVVEGRPFTPGLYEVIVGKKIADRVQGLDMVRSSTSSAKTGKSSACSPPTADRSRAKSGATTMPWLPLSAAMAVANRLPSVCKIQSRSGV